MVSGEHTKWLLLFYVFIMNVVPIIKWPCFKTEFRNNFYHKKLCYFLLSQFYFIHTEKQLTNALNFQDKNKIRYSYDFYIFIISNIMATF